MAFKAIYPAKRTSDKRSGSGGSGRRPLAVRSPSRRTQARRTQAQQQLVLPDTAVARRPRLPGGVVSRSGFDKTPSPCS